MKLCADCRHLTGSDDCTHPNVAIDLVSGGKRPRNAHNMRENDGPCGPEGRLFESRGVADPPPPEVPEPLPA